MRKTERERKESHTRRVAYERTSLGKRGARASNLPILPSLNVNSSFLIQSCSVPSSASRIGCMSCGRARPSSIANRDRRGWCGTEQRTMSNARPHMEVRTNADPRRGSNDESSPVRRSCRSCPRGKRQYPSRVLGARAPLPSDLSRDLCTRGTAASSCSTARILPLTITEIRSQEEASAWSVGKDRR